MLSTLRISQFALIDEVEIEFSEGLNLLTGETGSGKSIIVDALGALVGDRISSEVVKEGAETSKIEGLFHITPNRTLQDFFERSDFKIIDEILIRREISRSGKSKAFVNEHLVTQSFLKELGRFLVDIHSQGEQVSIFSSLTHLEMLDEYASLKKLREEMSKIYAEFSSVLRELKEIRSLEAQRLQMLDLLKFQIDEIKKANLSKDEEETLLEERKRLSNIEKLSELSEESYSLLYEEQNSVISKLNRVLRIVSELSEYQSAFRNYLEELKNLNAVLEDLASYIRSFKSSLDFSPERLEEIEIRLSEISRLKRKYGGSVESVLKHLDESEQKISKLESSQFHQEDLEKRVKFLHSECLKIARQIHLERKKAAKKFEKEVENNLKKVALEKSRFQVIIETNEEKLTPKGFDKVEFYFSANPGEATKPLAKVASGGEASRLMLILETTAKSSEIPKTMVFDEVDIGIGGRVAEAVGLKLKELAKWNQVLCVTHQPQVAALADTHFLVEKNFEKEKVTISVKKLDYETRVKELARMLSGKETTKTAEQHARELLKQRKS